MGLFSGWDFKDFALTAATGGLYGSGKLINDATKGSNGGGGGNPHHQQPNFAQADADTQKDLDKYYGSTLNNLGQENEDYSKRLYSNLDKNFAKQDIVNQQGSSQRALDTARAGLSGADMGAQNEQNRRSSGIEASVYNEQMRNQALGMYGDSIANRINSAASMKNQGRALEVASMQQPVAQASSGGLLSGIFDGIFG